MTLPTTRIDTLSSATPINPDDPQDILLVDFIPNGTPSATIVSGHHNNHNTRNVTSTSPEGTLSRFPTTYSSSNAIPTYNNHPNNIIRPEYRYNTNSLSNPIPPPTQDISNFTLVNLTNQPTNDPEDEEEEQQLESRRFSGNAGNLPPLKLKRNSFLSGHSSALVSNNSNFQKVSSSLTSSSSDDSDTGFLVPQNNGGARDLGKDKHNQHRIRRNNQIEATTPSYPGSPGFQPSHRKRLRRRRPSGGRRKSTQQHSMEHHDALSACCCLGDDEQLGPHQRTSLTSRYLRFSCFIVLIIAITTFASIVVSLQRKVDSLSAEVIKLGIDVAAGSSTLETSQSDQDIRKSLLQDLLNQETQVNVSLSALKNLIDDLNQKVSKLEKQPSIEQVRQEEARLGTDLRGYIDELKREFENFKTAHEQKMNHPANGGGESKVASAPVTTPSKEPT